MVFVHAHQYRSAVSAYAHDAKTFCIICAEDYEYLVDESIMHIGKGAWAKARAELQGLDSNVSEHATIDASSFDGDDESTSDFVEGVMRVQRTFLHYVPALLDGESVVQSTTESKPCCINPRRRQCMWEDMPQTS